MRSSIQCCAVVVLLVLVFATHTCDAFLSPSSIVLARSLPRSHTLRAKKSRAAKGFGKVEEKVSTEPSSSRESPPPPLSASPPGESTFLRSVDRGSNQPPKVDDSLTPEERAKAVLREQYGMKTLEEQQLSAKQLTLRKEEAKKWADMKKKAELNEDLDLFSMIPGPVIIAIDRFLKAGLAICSFLFILAGVGITLEAWSKATNSPLPENVDSFIVQTVEPNFTPGLLVLLGFSVTLGVFAALQLGSQGATYREDD